MRAQKGKASPNAIVHQESYFLSSFFSLCLHRHRTLEEEVANLSVKGQINTFSTMDYKLHHNCSTLLL